MKMLSAQQILSWNSKINSGILALKKCWTKCISVAGDYVWKVPNMMYIHYLVINFVSVRTFWTPSYVYSWWCEHQTSRDGMQWFGYWLQLLELSTRTGCQLKNTTKYGLSSVCSGQQRFTPRPAGPTTGPERHIIVAVDNCRVDQLVASYRVEMYGFVCNSAAAAFRRLTLGRPPTVCGSSSTPVFTAVRATVSAGLAQPLLSVGVLIALASSIGRLVPS